LILIAVGVLFLLDRMDKLDFGEVVGRYWPVIFILIGLSILINSNFRKVGSGLFFIIFGAIFLVDELGIFEHDIWHYWPVLIIAAGLWLILKPVFRRERINAPAIKEDDLNISIALSGLKRQVVSQNFRGGKASVVLGGIELDFTSASLSGGQATVDLTAVLGGIDLRVPKDWKLVIDSSPILGGVEDKRRPVSEAEAKATLFVKATAILGGIEIKD
jgi:predicted membrane protein